ncbi:LysE family translocator [Shewanella surugensis]|uniref:LysE family translocator n=1 Tax=Shewanella surugensis TaxID=212020 RepID=A0ABT0LJJ6_9GAMM|nr:LysE family translocator [Shewanella surugensis]MCL1127888.1 LysE family translocator [Shewanella surugensis]
MDVISLAVIGLLIVLSPGADLVLMMKNSLNAGRRAGLWTALGISLAIGVHIGYSLLGLSYLLTENLKLFNIIKYLGAAYLIYMGIKNIVTAKTSLAAPQNSKDNLHYFQYLYQGFLCNLLNPKTMLFFISLFSQLVSSSNNSWFFPLSYGAYIAVLHLLWFSSLAILLTYLPFKTRLSLLKTCLNRLCGGALIILGSLLAIRG